VSSAPSVEEFRVRVRDWLSANVPLKEPHESMLHCTPEGVARDRSIMRSLWEGRVFGAAVPEEYGGLGLTPAHEIAFREEAADFRMPEIFGNAVNIALPLLLTYGTEEQKKAFVPNILNGEHIWAQLLSEPSGGSDLAGALTRAVRDGDEWVINGAKIWTTAGNFCDFGLCLARTDPDVPKHAGLTMLIVPFDSPGLTVQPLTLVDGDVDFCQEFFDDVRIPGANVLGGVNNGWQIATTLMVNERSAIGRGWSLGGSRSDGTDAGIVLSRALLEEARRHGRDEDPHLRALIGEAWVLTTVQAAASRRVSAAIRSGELPGPAAALLKALVGYTAVRAGEIGIEVGGSASVAWRSSLPSPYGVSRLTSQNIGGGTTEMQLNAVAERLLGLPREPSSDRTMPFNQLRHNTMSATPARPGPERAG
jgi:alkylation response protein AidB-like acyl-CoA dehydrogenase